jgi:hypothetical protein
MQASIDIVNEKFGGGKGMTLASTEINSEWAMRRAYLSLCPITNREDLPKVT